MRCNKNFYKDLEKDKWVKLIGWGNQNEALDIIKESINKNQKIYLYCRSGNRSQKATDILIKIGYENVENLGSLNEAANFLKMKIIK